MLNEPITTVCMLSCRHQLQDDRIYWKEALTLAVAGYRVIHIAVGTQKADYTSAEGIRLIQIMPALYSKNKWLNRICSLITRRKHLLDGIFTAAVATNADVYHFHDLEINAIGSRLKGLPWHPKIIYDVHEAYADLIRDHAPRTAKWIHHLRAFYVDRMELAAAAHYDAIITTEPSVQKKFTGIAAGKPCEIIYNYSYFLPGQYPPAPKQYDAIYCGTISAQRGIIEIAKAVVLMKRRVPGICILVIGSFTSERLRQQVLLFIEQNDIGKNLLLHDAVPFEQIADFYRASRIGLCVLHPITLFKNAVFIKLFEYMAFDLPVVGSNFGTIEHYIQSSGAGVTTNALQPTAISNAVLQLLQDTDYYGRCSTAGINAVKEKYNWKKEAPKLLTLYKTILSVPTNLPASIA